MSIASGIGQTPSVFGGGGGGSLVYVRNNTQTITCNYPSTTFAPYPTQDLPSGVYLVSYGVEIINQDTAPITFTLYNQMLNDSTIIANQVQQGVVVQPTDSFSSVFTAVAYWNNSTAIQLVNNIIIAFTSGAFATTAPQLLIGDITITQIADV